MDRDDLQQLSKEQLIELVLRLQRPDKMSNGVEDYSTNYIEIITPALIASRKMSFVRLHIAREALAMEQTRPASSASCRIA